MSFRNGFAAFSAFIVFSGATGLIWGQSQADDANAVAPVLAIDLPLVVRRGRSA